MVPSKMLLFHMVKRPPKFPIEGEKTNLSRDLGQIFFDVKIVKKFSFCFLEA